MILSKQTTFSEDQAITATAISDVIQFADTGTVPGEAANMVRNLGPGNELPLLVQVTESFNNLTSLTITLETSANADLSSSTVLATSGAVALADLTAGNKAMLSRIMPDGEVLEYLGLRYTVAGSAPSTGKITAALGTQGGS